MAEAVSATCASPAVLPECESARGWNWLRRDTAVTFLSHRLLASTRISIEHAGGGFAGVVADAFDCFDMRFALLPLPPAPCFLAIDFGGRRFELWADGESAGSAGFPDGEVFRAFVAPREHSVALAAVPEIPLAEVASPVGTILFQNSDTFYDEPTFRKSNSSFRPFPRTSNSACCLFRRRPEFFCTFPTRPRFPASS
jgi:hypothetical protein